MSQKVSIILDDEVLALADRLASDRSSFINDVLWKEQQRIFMQELQAAYKEQADDPEFQDEILVWDVAVDDGLNA